MRVTAPGKIVAWGEYAVLAGAPAGVLAIDRYAAVELNPRESGWSFASSGLLAPGVRTYQADFTGMQTARIAESILQTWSEPDLSRPFALYTDSTSFYQHDGTKLGIGSSAAVCTATYAALAQLLSRTISLDEAMAMHRALQGGGGSGLDVAASWHGGALQFQAGTATPIAWPTDLHWRVFFTGESAATGAHIARFNDWQARADTAALGSLCAAAEALSADVGSVELWQAYVEALAALDAAADLNIFSLPHQELAKLASEHDLVYKPCGAGGGDIGMALGPDFEALDRFESLVRSRQYIPLELEIAAHGVKLDP